MSECISVSGGFTRLVSAGSDDIVVVSESEQSDDWRTKQVRQQALKEAEDSFNSRLRELEEKQRKFWESFESAFDKFVGDMDAKLNREVIELSARIAEVILRHELPDREMTSEVIREVLRPLVDFQGVQVRMNAEDAQWVEDEDSNSFLASLRNKVEIVGDNSLEPGDVMIKSRNGIFDARVPERLELVKEKLVERYNNASEEES